MCRRVFVKSSAVQLLQNFAWPHAAGIIADDF